VTDDLVAFLRQCVSADERAAREAHEAKSYFKPDGWAYWDEDFGGYLLCRREIGSDPHPVELPEYVLREVEMKRRILDEHLPWAGKQNDDGTYCSTCVGYPIESSGHIGVAWPCPTLRLLALPYAGRDGYRAEWSPDEETSRG
jgi:uncharacterized protein DUF6221